MSNATAATDGRHLSSCAKESLRLRAVRAVRVQGMKPVDVLRTMGVGKTSLYEWLCACDSGGEAALKAKKVGRRPGHTRLNKRQQNSIRKAVMDKHPDQLKLPFVMWNRAAVQRLIAKRYHVTLSLRAVGNDLQRWGMTPQKPLKRAYEKCGEQVKHWLNVTYPKIKQQAQEQRATIDRGDPMGRRSDPTARRSDSPKGKTPVLETTGKRFSCSMMSALTNAGNLSFTTFRGRFNAGILIAYLRRLIKHAGRKVLLILDGHPVHKSRKAKAWLAEHEEQIEVFLLPGYSPELAPHRTLPMST
ncbi:MAG: IS630 family transposase [Planctomycetota bacterium]